MPARPEQPGAAAPGEEYLGGVPPALETRELAKSFAGVHALRGVDLLVRPGEVHALMGENGAGKSTLIKLVTGVYRPDGGAILLGGRERAFRTPLEAQAAGISTIYQEVNLVPMMSVARNLFLGREPRRFGLVDLRRINRTAARILGEYGVRTDVTAPVHTLGLGARQMVALARAVQTDARVVIMDEPTSSLEPREVETLFGVIRTLRDRGVAVVFVSHRLDELYEICDRVTVLRDGRSVHSGAMAALPRMELVSLMLGRDLADAGDGRVTAFAQNRAARRPAEGDASISALLPQRRDRRSGAAAGAAGPALSISGLTDRHRLRGVSLEVAPGEVVGLGGLLGAGRSETAQAVIGARPAAGSVEVGGRRIRRRSPKAAVEAGIALLAEDRKAEGIIPGLSVRENIVLAALPRLSRAGIVSTARQERIVGFFMRRLRIKASSPEQKVEDLSGGNQQKVLLARWMCLNPGVLLLDEPTRGIDVGAKAEVQTIIDQLAAEGVAVLLISSELDELIEGSDRVVVLKTGAVAARLDGDEVSADHLMRALAGQDPGPGDADGREDPARDGPGGGRAGGRGEDRHGGGIEEGAS
ncbi:MAG TPA: sugar ABC transporter ATP-binding protein [Actinospica sp.]|nr:sugar ABC transporter ATP-binding protein [Actinospica sp.]